MARSSRAVAVGLAVLAAGVAPAIALAQSGSDAAGDQYGGGGGGGGGGGTTQTTPTTTTPPSTTPTNTTPTETTPTTTPTTTVGVTVTVGPTVTGSGDPTTPPTQLPPGTTTPQDDDGGTTGSGDPDDSGVAPTDDDGAGAAPDSDDGAGAAPDSAAGAGTGAAGAIGRRADACSTEVAVLTLGQEDDEAFDSVVKATGEPAYSATMRQRIPSGGLFAGLADADDASAFLRSTGARLGGGLGPASSVYLDGIPVLLTDLEGELAKVGGVVLVASAPSSSLDESDRDRRTALLTGLVRGLLERTSTCTVRAAAVETTDTDPTQLALFQKLGLPTVDNIEERVGRQALLAILQGYTGDFGRKKAADALLPTGPDGKPVRLATASSIQEADGPGGAALIVVLLTGLLTFTGLAVTADRRRRR